ncbi:MAG: hypothetical protein WA154_01550 [Moraxellaceae bacterium]
MLLLNQLQPTRFFRVASIIPQLVKRITDKDTELNIFSEVPPPPTRSNVATQLLYTVDCFELENMVVARLADDGSTTLNKLDRANYQQRLDDEYQLSELWLTDFQTRRHQSSHQSKILLLGLTTACSRHERL